MHNLGLSGIEALLGFLKSTLTVGIESVNTWKKADFNGFREKEE
jgi:hypothetical protein